MRSIARRSPSSPRCQRREGLDRRFDAAAELVAGEIMVEEFHLLALAFGGGMRAFCFACSAIAWAAPGSRGETAP